MSRSDSLRLFIFGMFAASLAAMMFYIPFEYMPFKLRISLTDQVGKPVAVTNLLLAGQLCERQLRDNLGGRLVSSYIDHRPSTIDPVAMTSRGNSSWCCYMRAPVMPITPSRFEFIAE